MGHEIALAVGLGVFAFMVALAIVIDRLFAIGEGAEENLRSLVGDDT